MDLSKAFENLNNEFLIAELKCYRLGQNAV